MARIVSKRVVVFVFAVVVATVLASVSLAATGPVSTVTDPVAGQIIGGASYSVSGTSTEDAAKVIRVEVSTDIGSTWSDAVPGGDVGTELIDTAGIVGNGNDIAIDGAGALHVVYTKDGDVIYATNQGGFWSYTAIDGTDLAGGYCSIATDNFNFVHICYNTGVPDSLRYVTNSGGVWARETVEAATYIGGFCDIALDPSGKAYISYADTGVLNDEKLKLATNAPGFWYYTTISGGGAGVMSSIAVDSDYHVHISSFINAGYDLKYFTDVHGNWTSITVDSTGYVGSGNSIAVDGSGFVHISYHDGSVGSIKYARGMAGWPWLIETVATGGYYGTSIALEAGIPMISFSNSDNIMLAFPDQSGWGTKVLDTVSFYPSYMRRSSIALSLWGDYHVIYQWYYSEPGESDDYALYHYDGTPLWDTWTYKWDPLPASDGEYCIISMATDALSNVETPTVFPCLTVDNYPPSTVITYPSNGSTIYGETCNITGTSGDGDGSGVQKVEISFDSGQTWANVTGIANWSYGWTLPPDGLYTILVRATDNAGHIQPQPAGCAVTVANTVKVLGIEPSVTPYARSGYDVSFTATASGRSGSFEYQFLLRGPDMSGPEPGGYAVMRNWSTSDTWTWTDIPYAAVGDNYIAVRVRETGQTVSANYGYIRYVIWPGFAVLDWVSANPPGPLDYGYTIPVTAQASGGSGTYEFRFQRRGPDTFGNYSVVQPWSASNVYGWPLTAAQCGNNWIACQVRSAGNTTTEDYGWFMFTVTAPPISIDSFTSIPAGQQLPPTATAFTVECSGGTGSYEYQFQRRGPDTGGVYEIALPWGSNNMLVYSHGLPAGYHYIVVQVRRSGGLASEAYDWMWKEVVP